MRSADDWQVSWAAISDEVRDGLNVALNEAARVGISV